MDGAVGKVLEGQGAMSTIVYRYGLLSPTCNADIVESQMRGAHAYRNKLVEIERRRRDARMGPVGVDVGWRLRPDGTIRVAMTCDRDGRGDEILLPPEVPGSARRVASLRATRDKNMDAARSVLVSWLRDQSLPDEWAQRTESVSQWRSQGRLAGLSIWWREHRLPNDEDAFAALETWRKQDKHLWCWETSERTGGLRHRKDLYRRVAARLAERHDVLVMEADVGLREFALRPAIDDPTTNETARSNRVVAAVSELRMCLRQAFLRRGRTVVSLPAQGTTRTCAACGSEETWDQANEVRHTCKNGHVWDQDANAARNLIERWRAEPSGEGARVPEPSAPSEGRWSRARNLARERAERMGRSRIAKG